MKVTKRETLVAAGLIWALIFCTLVVLPVANAKGVKLLVRWRNSDYSGPKPHRILVIGMSENPEIRADFEDDLSSAIANDSLEAVPGNSILFRPHSAELDPDYLKGQFVTSRSTPSLFRGLSKSTKRSPSSPAITMPFLTPTATHSTVITARSTSRCILLPAGWGTHLDRHERSIQSEVSPKSNRWGRQADRKRVEQARHSVRDR